MLAIFVSASVALVETIDRLVHPEELSHLWVLAAAGAVGFLGNEIAARVRMRSGARLSSTALVADGKHARVDGFVSLGVVVSAALVALGWEAGDHVGLVARDPGRALIGPASRGARPGKGAATKIELFYSNPRRRCESKLNIIPLSHSDCVGRTFGSTP